MVRHSSSAEDMVAMIDGAFSSLQHIRLKHHTVLTGCLLVCKRCVYECRPRVSPERMFLDMTIDNYDTEVTEELGMPYIVFLLYYMTM